MYGGRGRGGYGMYGNYGRGYGGGGYGYGNQRGYGGYGGYGGNRRGNGGYGGYGRNGKYLSIILVIKNFLSSSGIYKKSHSAYGVFFSVNFGVLWILFNAHSLWSRVLKFK